MGLAPGQPTARGARACRTRWSGVLGAWPLWSLPSRLRGYLLTVVAAGFAAVVAAACITPCRARDAIMYAALLALGAAGVEALRRTGEPAGPSRDAHGLWELAVAVLLPPFYVMTAPILVMALTQWRVRRTVAHRRVFSAAAVGLSYGAASVAFHAAWGGAGRLPASQAGMLGWGLLATACAILRWVINTALVVSAVRLDDPAARLADLLGGRRGACHDIAEMCVGVLIAFAAALGPVLLIFALPCGIQLQRSARRAQLLHPSRADRQTGLLSPLAWQREAAVEMARTTRTARSLAIAIVEIDHYRWLAQDYGRTAADWVVCEAARTLASLVRENDIAGRFRGGEFILLLPGADAAVALRVAERLRGALGSIIVPTGAGSPAEQPRITVSIGVAALGGTICDLTELLTAADAALFEARSGGRNTVRLAGQPPPVLLSRGGRSPVRPPGRGR